MDLVLLRAMVHEETRNISPYYLSCHLAAADDDRHREQFRYALVQALSLSVLTSAYVNATILPMAMRAFHHASCDRSSIVRQQAKQALVACDALLKPRLPPMIRRTVLHDHVQQVIHAEKEVDACGVHELDHPDDDDSMDAEVDVAAVGSGGARGPAVGFTPKETSVVEDQSMTLLSGKAEKREAPPTAPVVVVAKEAKREEPKRFVAPTTTTPMVVAVAVAVEVIKPAQQAPLPLAPVMMQPEPAIITSAATQEPSSSMTTTTATNDLDEEDDDLDILIVDAGPDEE